MNEPYETSVLTEGPREWLTLQHPTEKWYIDGSSDEPMPYHFDVAWFLSRWECGFGDTCNKTTEDAPDMSGCCRWSFFVYNDEDLQHIKTQVAELTDEDWQNRKEGLKNGWLRKSGNDLKGRVHQKVCIFHNTDPDRLGCAFHKMAERKGLHHTETKPHVCWQQPMFRVEDEEGVTIRPSKNFDWGQEEWEPLDWWTTESPEMYVGKQPVYLSHEHEIRKMVGDVLYEQLRAYCDAVIAAVPRDNMGRVNLPIVAVNAGPVSGNGAGPSVVDEPEPAVG